MAHGATQTSMLLPILVFDTLKKMIASKAEGNRRMYWVHFTSVCRLMKPHVKTSYRTEMQKEYAKIQELIFKVKGSNIHDESKSKQILEMQFIYADNRESIIYDALPNIGLGPDIIEGEINFTKIDIDKLAELVQGKQGYVVERSSEILGTEKKIMTENLEHMGNPVSEVKKPTEGDLSDKEAEKHE